MNKLLLTAAMAGLTAAAFAAPVMAADAAKEKCYGVAMAGKNDCASANGSHSCAGQATTNKDPNEWNLVVKGECTKLGGSLTPPAK